MAFSSSQVKYDVFLSFRGEDTRDNFTSHLKDALCGRKIVTFIDDQLVRGDEISPSLLSAISGSKISIIIFSKGYASSTWCLQELVEILNCKRMYGQIVIPVFYHVDPSDVRKQTGTYGDAFGQHEVRYMEKKEMLQRWRNALTEAANISGFDSNKIRPESKLVDTITECILESLNDKSYSDNKKLVGVAMKIHEIKSLLSDQSSKVCKVGLWGMGGRGKTTLAEAVFNEISSRFEASYFARNVREKASNSKQIEEFTECPKVLGFGSQIIITTRDKQLLTICGLDDSTIYEVKGLDSVESLTLFKQHAFKKNQPIDEVYLKLSERVIRYTRGLPLALKVLGSHLLGKEELIWKSALDDLQKSPCGGIQKVLKISYDGLSDEEKTLFLDIICFFKGWDKYLVGTFSSHSRIRDLVDKALISVSFTTIGMHDLIEEMGWEIVRQESINKLGQRNRLWYHDDVYHVLKKNLGTDEIRGMLFNMVEMTEIDLKSHAFSKMTNLRVLVVKHISSRDNNKIHGFDSIEFDFTNLESLPNTICKLNSLKYICISGCSKLERLPDDLGKLESLEGIEASGITVKVLPSVMAALSALRFLRRLELNYCSITELPNNIDNLSLLVDLELEGNNFETIPTNIMNLSKLQSLNIRFCDRLRSLPKLPRSIKKLLADGCKLLKELSVLTNLITPGPDRRTLNLFNCVSLDWDAIRNILIGSILNTFSSKIYRFAYKVSPKRKSEFCYPQSFVVNLEAGICYLGSDIPEWFNIQSSGSVIPFLQFGISYPAGSGIPERLNIRSSGSFRLKREVEICYPGSDIPEWFNIQSSGSVIKLPQGSFNEKVLDLAFCFIVEVEDNSDQCNFFGVSSSLRQTGPYSDGGGSGEQTYLLTKCVKSDHVLVIYDRIIWEIFHREDFKFACDKEAIFSFYPSSSFRFTEKNWIKNIKKCGVRLLFTDELEETMKRPECSIYDDERGFKSSNFYKGKSSSRQLGPSIVSQPLPDCMTEKGELERLPREVLKHRYTDNGELEVFVAWKNLSEFENSWEQYTAFKQAFPQFHLEDKVPLDGKGNVRSRIYVSRKRKRAQMKGTPGNLKLKIVAELN
ncbi:disease resistance protein Roq1-like [Mangifera indica]|uniref:disease resistance protein Roq1-like n=1 Tax=Mangifera indica TaxID=29780 RepID=UPI001CF9A075|nr:disease resistance protein Roq1-like [Mangifera indica]